MGDTSQPTGLDKKPSVTFESQIDCRRQIQSLPRDFRQHDSLTNDIKVSAKFYSVPRHLQADVEFKPPKRKGGLPRLLDLLTRRASKELQYYKQENDSTEGSTERDSVHQERHDDVTSSRPTSILLRPWLATEKEAASLTGLSKSPLLSSPEVTESASLTPSLLNILQIIQTSSVYLSDPEPPWIREENIPVIAHIEYKSTRPEHLSFKVGQLIFQKRGVDDNGLAHGTMKRHRFSKQKTGYYPANYVIPKPVKEPFQIFRLFRRNLSRRFTRGGTSENPIGETKMEASQRSSLPFLRMSSRPGTCTIYPVVDWNNSIS
ncbi:uncharacterized protein LOC135475029 [Liolophura sinensis]|uniref:uncharacterized protein LOC135475029 n=1 Tax=Liolophura sinensis TaxID=3198878 RepID=UPI003158B9CF